MAQKEEKPLEEQVKECPENNFCHRSESEDSPYCTLSYMDPPEVEKCPFYNNNDVVMVSIKEDHARRYHICNAPPSDNQEQ